MAAPGGGRDKMSGDMHELKSDGIGFVAGRWPLDKGLATVVFMHGSGGSRVLWHPQVEALADRMNTVAVDLPGRGRSDGEGLSSIPGYAARVAEFIESIEAPRPVPCGLSIGGGIVLQPFIPRYLLGRCITGRLGSIRRFRCGRLRLVGGGHTSGRGQQREQGYGAQGQHQQQCLFHRVSAPKPVTPLQKYTSDTPRLVLPSRRYGANQDSNSLAHSFSRAAQAPAAQPTAGSGYQRNLSFNA